jgi:hypothetical protein
MQVTAYQRVEFDGKTYDLVWYGEKARVSVLTKKGPRTLNGHGRAGQTTKAAQVIAEARRQKKD